jgi:hypothetical protein
MSPPSSRHPAGIPESGGNAKYAIVALVLVVAAGGLFAYRSCSSKAPAPTATLPPLPSVSASAVATNPLLDDVPPPPPPDVVPEAGSKTANNNNVIPPGGGCTGTCSGTAPAELGQALQVRAAQARRCYNQALANDSSLRGHVSIAVRIGPGGNVCSANVAANDMGSPSVAQCAANIFRSAGSYPAPRGGCVDATVPMSFVPQGQ